MGFTTWSYLSSVNADLLAVKEQGRVGLFLCADLLAVKGKRCVGFFMSAELLVVRDDERVG